jgi:hypothetical protein
MNRDLNRDGKRSSEDPRGTQKRAKTPDPEPEPKGPAETPTKGGLTAQDLELLDAFEKENAAAAAPQPEQPHATQVLTPAAPAAAKLPIVPVIPPALTTPADNALANGANDDDLVFVISGRWKKPVDDPKAQLEHFNSVLAALRTTVPDLHPDKDVCGEVSSFDKNSVIIALNNRSYFAHWEKLGDNALITDLLDGLALKTSTVEQIGEDALADDMAAQTPFENSDNRISPLILPGLPQDITPDRVMEAIVVAGLPPQGVTAVIRSKFVAAAKGSPFVFASIFFDSEELKEKFHGRHVRLASFPITFQKTASEYYERGWHRFRLSTKRNLTVTKSVQKALVNELKIAEAKLKVLYQPRVGFRPCSHFILCTNDKEVIDALKPLIDGNKTIHIGKHKLLAYDIPNGKNVKKPAGK